MMTHEIFCSQDIGLSLPLLASECFLDYMEKIKIKKQMKTSVMANLPFC